MGHPDGPPWPISGQKSSQTNVDRTGSASRCVLFPSAPISVIVIQLFGTRADITRLCWAYLEDRSARLVTSPNERILVYGHLYLQKISVTNCWERAVLLSKPFNIHEYNCVLVSACGVIFLSLCMCFFFFRKLKNLCHWLAWRLPSRS